jgi:hypothetical protein
VTIGGVGLVIWFIAHLQLGITVYTLYNSPQLSLSGLAQQRLSLPGLSQPHNWSLTLLSLLPGPRTSCRSTSQSPNCRLRLYCSARGLLAIHSLTHYFYVPAVTQKMISDPARRRSIANAGCCLHAGFLLNLFFQSWRWRRYVLPKRRLTLYGLHGVISQKMVLLILLCSPLKFMALHLI